MKTSSISSAKNRLSALIDLVRKGETVTITDRDQPVAQLAPLPPSSVAASTRLAALERSGLVKRARTAAGKDLLERLPPMPPTEADVLGALLAERDEGR
ncbi:MAG: type II toxin-antitoxin system prevent-host-death family antitoxin [Xanthomonadales bacterium]|nr:type II toxin-antitoxin system prevent-host-death family antitoxin [Xanthomonadales bacterium]